MSNRGLQQIGEDAAVRFLERRGMRILVRNWRIKLGEIDIVAADGATLVFVEVKARGDGNSPDPELAVGHAKQKRLRRLAEAYLAFERPEVTTCRFDVVAVVANMPEPVLRHIPNAF